MEKKKLLTFSCLLQDKATVLIVFWGMQQVEHRPHLEPDVVSRHTVHLHFGRSLP